MHLFYLREAWRSFKQHRGLATTGILSLTAALTLSGMFLLLAHNCANVEATRKSYELIARYVMPAVNRSNAPRHASIDWASA